MAAMTHEEIASGLLEMFPQCPDPLHQPRLFQYYLKLYLYYTDSDPQ